jgi:branched-subunit amino acid aminotransferase/4-amino-4-deoxychorismate lyase
MRRDCNEVVLVDEQGLVYEGLSSNVLALDSTGTLWTAPSETVLTGTVLQLVLSVCEASHIPVERLCPTVDLLCRSSVLISSTSRLALPVEKMYLLDGTVVTLPFSDMAKDLVGKVKERVDKACTRIL